MTPLKVRFAVLDWDSDDPEDEIQQLINKSNDKGKHDLPEELRQEDGFILLEEIVYASQRDQYTCVFTNYGAHFLVAPSLKELFENVSYYAEQKA